MSRYNLFQAFFGVIILQLCLWITPVQSIQAGETLEYRFEGPPFRMPTENRERFPDQRITGKIFAPWVDDSAWCDIEVDYQVLTENPGEGNSSQRITVKRLPKGSRAQFGLRDFPLNQNEEIRIRFLAKSQDMTPFTASVTQRKPPYTRYHSQRFQPANEWREFEFFVPGMFNDPETRFEFIIEQEGTLDLDHFRSERRQAEALKIPDDRLANLLPSSAFPLGAAPPWVVHGFGSVKVSELLGPHGTPALELEVRRQPGFARFEQSVRTAFRALPDHPVTVRISARLLEGECQIALRAGVERIWEAPFGMSTEMIRGWRTYEHTVQLPISPHGYYQVQYAFEGEGRVAIERVQISQAGEPLALTGPVEIALNSAVPYGLAVDDEPFTVRFTAWGDITRAKGVVLTLNDLLGNQVQVGRYLMPEQAYSPVEIEITPPDTMPKFGSFRLEAQAVTEDGKPIGIPAELLLHRVRQARFADQIASQSFFGIHYRTSHLDAVGLETLKKLGFNWLRLFKTFSWKRVEATQGNFDFSQTDRDVELLEQYKFNALGILGDGAPNWAAKNRDPQFVGWACWTPRDPVEFADYAAKIFERYGDKVTHFEPWNEPYYPGFFTERIEQGRRVMGSAADYATIQRLIFERARASGKNIQIGWNTNTLAEIHRTKEWLELGITDHVDFISLHHYLGQPDPAPEITLQVNNLRELLGEKKFPIWNSEGGLGPFTAFNLYKHMPPFQDDSHQLVWADWYVRYHLACLAAGVKHYFAYLWSAPNFWMPDYSLNNIDGRISANLTAISALAWQVDGLAYAKSHTFAGGRARAEIFTASDESVACIIPSPGYSGTIPQKAGLTAYDLFGNELKPGSDAPGYIYYLRSADPVHELVKLLK